MSPFCGFLARAGARYGRIGMTLGANAERALLAYAWPGNVRELSHVLERAVLMGQGERAESLEFGLGDATLGLSAALAAGGEAAAPGDDLDLDRAEERMVRRALERSEGNVQRAAELLGLSRAALYRRFEKFGIQV